VQLNSILRIIKTILSKKARIKLNSALIIPITGKPLEARMGTGKAERQTWKSPISKGMIVIEVDNVTKDEVLYILNIIKRRIPFLTKIVKKVY
jgi:ribosomal protein L16/L10AE